MAFRGKNLAEAALLAVKFQEEHPDYVDVELTYERRPSSINGN